MNTIIEEGRPATDSSFHILLTLTIYTHTICTCMAVSLTKPLQEPQCHCVFSSHTIRCVCYYLTSQTINVSPYIYTARYWYTQRYKLDAHVKQILWVILRDITLKCCNLCYYLTGPYSITQPRHKVYAALTLRKNVFIYKAEHIFGMRHHMP